MDNLGIKSPIINGKCTTNSNISEADSFNLPFKRLSEFKRGGFCVDGPKLNISIRRFSCCNEKYFSFKMNDFRITVKS